MNGVFNIVFIQVLRKNFLFVCIILSLLCSITSADTHYASSLGSNEPPYTSWTTAAHDIQDAINAASPGDVIVIDDEIWNISTTLQFDLPAGSYELRSRSNNPEICILDGQGKFRIMQITHPGVTVTIRGITFCNSKVTVYSGGALMVGSKAGDVRLYNCIFKKNISANPDGSTAGGAIFVDRPLNNKRKIEIYNCKFLENEANGIFSGRGGAIYIHEGNEAIIANCFFKANATNSTDDGEGSCLYIRGIANIKWCIFENHSGHDVHGTVISYGDNAFVTIEDSIFDSNNARWGGGFYTSQGGFGHLKRCVFINNYATDLGGAIYAGGWGDLIVESSLFISNVCGGDVAFNGGGGAAYCHLHGPLATRDKTDKFLNCTFVDNDCEAPDCVDCIYARKAGSSIYNITVNVKNCIIKGGDAEKIGGPGTASLVVSYCNIEGGYSGPGNIDLDPKFVNPLANDFHLQPTSPCIDAGTSNGTPEIDLDGNCRYDDPNVENSGAGMYPYYDIGAYEFFPVCNGDVDNDGDVDGSDLAVFASDYGRTNCCEFGIPCEGNFDDDCDVDDSDLAIFTSDFGRTYCPKCP